MAYFPNATYGGSPAIDELKGATLIASGSSTTYGLRIIPLETVNAVRFYIGAINNPTTSECQQTYFGGYNTIHRFYMQTSMATTTIYYAVYRVDET